MATATATATASASASSPSSSSHSSSNPATADAIAFPARSSSPLPLSAPPPPLPSSASSRRLPPPCWTHEETVALIDSYRDKWYSLRRGNLRAAHWQEVADAVSRRCHRLPAASPKTSVQCRHKVEKLRKRYRAEKQRSFSHDPSAPPTSSWVYFRKMDAMESAGGGAVSNRSPAAAPPDDDDEEDDDAGDRGGGPTRSLHRLMANGSGGRIGGLRFTIPKAVRSKVVGSRAEDKAAPRRPSPSTNPSSRSWGFGGAKPAVEEMRRRLEKKRWKEKREKGEGSEAVGEMVMALRMLGDTFMRMEQMKMEMAREMEKVRMEMELKRTEMILDFQRRVAESLTDEFVGKKKRARVSPDS